VAHIPRPIDVIATMMASTTNNEIILLEQVVDVYSWNTTSSCDRRLSRAARSLLQRHLRRLDPSLPSNDKQQVVVDDVWTLLDQWLETTARQKCPLNSNMDVLRHDEEHSIAIPIPSNLNGAYPTQVLQQRRKNSPRRPSHWWQCGYCGKTFGTRFYLDLHLQQHHHHHPSQSIENDGMICPAKDWCRVVGLANCHAQALVEEPFYDRGSGGWGADRTFVQHKWTKVAHSVPCNVTEIQMECRSVMETACGGNMMSSSNSSELFCESLSCPSHHHFWQQDSGSDDHWYEMWLLEKAQHHSRGLLGGMLFCVALCLSVYALSLPPPKMKKGKRHNHPGRRLLQKSTPIAKSQHRFLSETRNNRKLD
jgi:hypothetical protein